ncbi:MAG: type IV secretory system conjugative DNA transfer family protein, partial [Candidatus Micrarchaeaceae archaeon]
GMTGSGKTYLTKSLMLRLYAVLECIVIVIDFTGEYEEFARRFSAECPAIAGIPKLIGNDANKIIYINLSRESEQKKVKGATAALQAITNKMRARGFNGNARSVFVILDEAWKMMEKSRPLEIIIREGRKYKVGIVVASQIIRDVDLNFIGNIATIFAFRVQDRDSLSIFQKNYGLRDEQIAGIQNQELGGCFVIQLSKYNLREAFFIRRVSGVETNATARIVVGDKMAVEVNSSKFEELVRKVCSGSTAREIISKANDSGFIRLDALIKQVICSNGDRRALLAELRKLGIRLDEIADAFAAAVEDSGN